jgi:hypothetical protein
MLLIFFYITIYVFIPRNLCILSLGRNKKYINRKKNYLNNIEDYVKQLLRFSFKSNDFYEFFSNHFFKKINCVRFFFLFSLQEYYFQF